MLLYRLGLLSAMVAAAAAGAQINCVANVPAASVPVFALVSTTGTVASYPLSCTAGIAGGPQADMNFEAFLNVTVLPTGGWTLTGGISTVTGIKVNSNSIEFDDVKFDASQSTINFTIQGQQVNPSLWGPGFPFNEDVAAAGNYTLGIVDSIQLVGVNESVPEPATLLWCGLALCCLKARVARRDPRQA